MARRVLRTLTVAERVDMIKCLENKESQVSVAKKFGVHQSLVSRVGKNKAKILKEWQNNSNPYRKRIRAGKSEDVEAALRQWFYQARSRQIPVTGPLLKRKASKLARDFGLTDFKVTTGWLERWKARNAIKLRRRKGVPQDGKDSAVETWVVQVVPETPQDDDEESDVERKVDAPVNGVASDTETEVYADNGLSETSIDSADSIDISPSPTSEQKNNDDVDNSKGNDNTVSLVTVVQCLHVIRRFMEEKGCRSYKPLYNLQDLLYRLNQQEHTPTSISMPMPSS